MEFAAALGRKDVLALRADITNQVDDNAPERQLMIELDPATDSIPLVVLFSGPASGRPTVFRDEIAPDALRQAVNSLP